MNNIERFRDYCQKHRLVSFLIIIGIIVVALGKFTKGLDDIIEFAHKHRPTAVRDEQTPVKVLLKPQPAPAPNPDATAKEVLNEKTRAQAVAVKLPEETKVVAVEAASEAAAAAQPAAQSAKSTPVTPPKSILKTHKELIAEIEAKVQAAQEQGIDPNKVLTADEALMHNLELMKKPAIITTAREMQIGAIPKPPVDQIRSYGETNGEFRPGIKEKETLANAIATKDIGSLRVVLKSVMPMKLTGRNGRNTNGIRCSFEFMNRETQRPMVVAMNAESRNRDSPAGTPLRSSVLDDRGGVWNLSSSDLGGLGFVRAGVHGRNGQDAYSASEIVKLLRLRDQLGRDTDDPADGIYANADSIGEGGYNYTSDSSRGNISPRKFFAFNGNAFISGSPTTIEPGQSINVIMDFESTPESSPAPKSFQFTGEIVAGVVSADRRTSYSLQSLTFDRVTMPRQ